MVIGNNSIELYPKERVKLKVDAYCMNLSCGCAHGETMYLTDLYMTNEKVGGYSVVQRLSDSVTQ